MLIHTTHCNKYYDAVLIERARGASKKDIISRFVPGTYYFYDCRTRTPRCHNFKRDIKKTENHILEVDLLATTTYQRHSMKTSEQNFSMASSLVSTHEALKLWRLDKHMQGRHNRVNSIKKGKPGRWNGKQNAKSFRPLHQPHGSRQSVWH